MVQRSSARKPRHRQVQGKDDVMYKRELDAAGFDNIVGYIP